MVYPQIEEQLSHARHDLQLATSENIIDLYLAFLSEYRSKLYELQGTPGINQQSASPTSPDDVGDTRRAIRAAIENTTKERKGTEMLLLSITTVSGYEAVEIFNRRKYEGHNDWELRSSWVKFSGGTDDAATNLLAFVNAFVVVALLMQHLVRVAIKPFNRVCSRHTQSLKRKRPAQKLTHYSSAYF